jgi:hypothetical protein
VPRARFGEILSVAFFLIATTAHADFWDCADLPAPDQASCLSTYSRRCRGAKSFRERWECKTRVVWSFLPPHPCRDGAFVHACPKIETDVRETCPAQEPELDLKSRESVEEWTIVARRYTRALTGIRRFADRFGACLAGEGRRAHRLDCALSIVALSDCIGAQARYQKAWSAAIARLRERFQQRDAASVREHLELVRGIPGLSPTPEELARELPATAVVRVAR